MKKPKAKMGQLLAFPGVRLSKRGHKQTGGQKRKKKAGKSKRPRRGRLTINDLLMLGSTLILEQWQLDEHDMDDGPATIGAALCLLLTAVQTENVTFGNMLELLGSAFDIFQAANHLMIEGQP